MRCGSMLGTRWRRTRGEGECWTVTRGLGGDREREGRPGRKHESELELVGENCTIVLMHS
jgi:hypothetical protein